MVEAQARRPAEHIAGFYSGNWVDFLFLSVVVSDEEQVCCIHLCWVWD